MPESLVGQTLAGNYLVEAVLGDGGMGTVVAARHLEQGECVAIKILRADLADNEYVVSRFLREGRISTRLGSQHVVKVRDVGRLDDGVPFMVMERLEGEDLEQRLKRDHHLPIETAVDFALHACDALAAAHAAGIVHRDIKPGNLFITEQSGQPLLKVFDFGISKVEHDEEGHRTSAQEIFGSPFYMSPEQLLSSTDVDTRADIWSLGVVLYEMLTGKLPFQADVLAKLHLAVLQGDPIDIRTHGIDIPDRLAEVVHSCLAREREDRWQSMRALAEHLEHYASPNGLAALEALRTKHEPNLTPAAGVPAPRPSLRSLGTTSERQIAVQRDLRSNKTLTPWEKSEEPKRRAGALVGVIACVVLVLGAIALHPWRAEPPAAASEPPPPTSERAPEPTVTPSAVTPSAAPVESAPAPEPRATTEKSPVEGTAEKKRPRAPAPVAPATKPNHTASSLPDDRQ